MAESKPAEDKSQSSLKSREYQAQLFNQTSESVADEVYNIIFDYNHDAIRTTYEYLTQKFPDIDRDVIKSSSEAVKNELTTSAESLCDELEQLLAKSVMKIPSNVILPEDELHVDKNISTVSELQLDRELMNLRNQIEEEIATNQVLRSEQQNLQSLLSFQGKVLETSNKAEMSIPNIEKLPETIKEIANKVKGLSDTLNDL